VRPRWKTSERNLVNDMAKPKSGRTVTPDGEKIQRLRIEKGWSLTRFAAKSGISERNIQRIESGKPCYLCTLAAIAQALGVECKEILVGLPPEPVPANHVQLAVKHGDKFSEFDQCDQLVALIGTLHTILGSDADVSPSSIEDGGNALLTLTMDREHLREFLIAFIDSKLAALNITAVKFRVVGDQAGSVGLQLATLSDKGEWLGPDEGLVEDAVYGRIELFGHDNTRL
jgi:transcriptional regulator with XRE-family HTH domain